MRTRAAAGCGRRTAAAQGARSRAVPRAQPSKKKKKKSKKDKREDASPPKLKVPAQGRPQGRYAKREAGKMVKGARGSAAPRRRAALRLTRRVPAAWLQAIRRRT